MRTVQTLSSHDAQQLVSTVLAELTARGAKGVVAVVDHHGELLAFVRMDGAPLPSTTIAINKAYSAARTRKPTRDIGKKVRSADQGFDIAYYGDSRIVGWGGGMPVMVDGVCVGAVSVSGLTEDEDAEIAARAIAKLLA